MTKNIARWILKLKVIGELLFLYGLLAWAYGVIVQLTHPNWLPLRLSHLTGSLRVDTFTIASFIVSAVGFFIWRSVKELASSDK